MFAELVESELRWWDLVCASTRVEIQFPTLLLKGFAGARSQLYLEFTWTAAQRTEARPL